MTNHITNIVKATGTIEQLKAYEEFMATPDESNDSYTNFFDFMKLIPHPVGMDMDEEVPGHVGSTVPRWYEWQIENWGTKWNSYDLSRKRYYDYPADTNYDIRTSTIVFDTAWNTPRPVFDALFAKFPDLTFEIHYADEAIGENCGIIRGKSGVCSENIDRTGDVAFAEGVKAQSTWSRIQSWDHNE